MYSCGKLCRTTLNQEVSLIIVMNVNCEQCGFNFIGSANAGGVSTISLNFVFLA